MKRSYSFLFSGLVVLAFVFFVPTKANAQLMNSPDAYKNLPQSEENSAGAMLGASKYDEDFYLDLDVLVTLNLGKIALGLALPVHVLVYDADPENTNPWYQKYLFRKSDWDEVGDYFRIIRYLRYGCKYCEENYVYGMFGDLHNVTMGHGTIVGLYYNNLQPQHYKPGLQLDAYWPKHLGVETLLNNITNPNLMGSRIYVKPVSFFLDEDSYLNNLALGMSVFTDINAPKTLKFDSSGKVESDDSGYPKVATDEALTILGWDAEFRVLNTQLIRLTPFLDVNHIVHHGTGMHLGVLTDFTFGDILTLNTRLEYRYFGDDYIPVYFDSYYEIGRYMFAGSTIPKQSVIDKMDAKHGYYAGASFFFMNLVRIGATLEDYQGKNNTTFLMFADVPALEVIEFSAWYMKSNFEYWENVFEFDDRSLLVAQAKIHYSVMVIMLQATRTWKFDEDKGKYEPMDDYSVGVGVEFTF